MIPKHASKSLFITIVVNMALFGASITMFGAAIPKIIRLFDWSYSAAGIVLAASSVGYFISTFVSGFVIKKIGGRWLIVTTLLIEGISFLFFARFPSVVLNAFLNFLIGLGHGGTEVVSNVTLIRIERDGKSRLMNLIHSSFCVGAVIGPLGIAGLVSSTASWRAVFPVVGSFILLTAGVFFTRRFPDVRDRRPSAREARHGPPDTGGGGASRLLIGFYAILILLYVGIELSMSNWSAEFFVIRLGATEGAGAFMVAVLWIGLFMGRICLSLFYHGTKQEVVLLVLNIASAVFILLMIVSRSLPVSAILVFFLGLGLSGVYPLIMTLVGKGTHSTVAVGVVSTAGGVGSFSFPYILAFIADFAGIHKAFFLCFAVAVAALLFNIAAISLIRKAHRGLDSLKAEPGGEELREVDRPNE
jgi:FHS family glucose/mannose:H+ symporter-like MFS transporter